MALVIKDRVRVACATTGTGVLTLGSAIAASNKGYFRSFADAGVANGDTVPYLIEDGANWETGIGTYATSGTTLTRTTVVNNSAGNTSPISLSGAAEVSIVMTERVFGLLTREKLQAARTYYVRTDGNDANTGLANNSGNAFLTVQKALDTVHALDLNGFDVIISIANGTYAGFHTEAPFVGNGFVTVRGNTGSPQSVIFNTTVQLGDRAVLSIEGARFTTTDGDGIRVIERAILYLSTVQFGAIDDAGILIDTGLVTIYGNYAVVGSCGAGHIVIIDGSFRCLAVAVTMTGTPNIGIFVAAYTAGAAWFDGPTFSGSATGKRYEAGTNGVIEVNGAGANYLPGNSAGTAGSGGQYV